MASPDDRAESISQRHGQLLRRVQNVAAQLREVTDAGPAMFDDGVSGDSQLVWQERIETLGVEGDHAEFEAMLEGVDPGWVVDARELGHRGASSPSRHVVRQHPARANEAQEFYLDMLEVDLWNLERMASLEASRVHRITTGRWTLDRDPIAAAQFADNMTALHTRITVLAAAAQLTAPEGDSLWGSSVEGIRRVHAVTFAAHDDQTLAQQWNGYARADPALAVPPYVPRDPETGNPTDTAMVAPPTPRKMLADATSALRVQVVDTAIRNSASTDLAAESAAITAVVDAALGDDQAWTWEPDHDPAPGQVREISTDRGPEP
ncbi:hypothetical protein ACFWPX_03265 [Nocardia sp. NPDC058518]|uniref:hypothetical protein n=1 Tax=Nocardia sp. NPDC058518 TaxID=3346534 RepID=UPI0036688A3E